MGTITERARNDGSIGYTAQIRIKRKGAVVFSESQTFNRRPAAIAWLKHREKELAVPGALERAKIEDPPLAEVIDRYIGESEKEIGRTKSQVLRAIKASDLGRMACSEISSSEIVSFARGLDALPQTRGNYLSHLSAIFAVARPAWKYPLDPRAMEDAAAVTKRLGLTSKSAQRTRRPTLAELDRIMEYFVERQKRAPDSAPMHLIIAFAIFSTRRLEELTRIKWADLDAERDRIMVRDMKHPGQKIGNNVSCQLVPEALRLIEAMPRKADELLPYNPDSIGTAFTRGMQFLTIKDLHFHDLRHEGISRLFEMGWTIPRVAEVSGHRSWQSLQRYSHYQQTGDKFEGWPWLATLTKGSST